MTFALPPPQHRELCCGLPRMYYGLWNMRVTSQRQGQMRPAMFLKASNWMHNFCGNKSCVLSASNSALRTNRHLCEVPEQSSIRGLEPRHSKFTGCAPAYILHVRCSLLVRVHAQDILLIIRCVNPFSVCM